MKNADCPCKRTECVRHGSCDGFRAYHHSLNGRKSLTRCKKIENKEKRKAEILRKRER